MATVNRKHESAFKRWLILNWPPTVFAILSIVLALVLIYRVDGLLVTAKERESFLDIFHSPGAFDWRVSDITTLISASLVVIRLVGSSWSTLVVWRCIMVLLQKEGLRLHQISSLASSQLHFPWSWGGLDSVWIALVTLALLPASINAPLLTGSIDWQPTARLEAGIGVRDGFGTMTKIGSEWFFRDIETRKDILLSAMAHAFVPWTEAGPEIQTTSRYAARDTAIEGAIVTNVSMPFMDIHSIAWHRGPWDNTTFNIVSNISIAREFDYIGDDWILSDPAPGQGILVADFIPLEPKNPYVEPTISIPARPIVMNLLMKLSSQSTPTNCASGINLGGSFPDWGELSMTDVQTKTYDDGTVSCWALGTVNLTVGIKTFNKGRYISRRAIEGIPSDQDSLVDDPWAVITLRMLPNLMTTPSMNQIEFHRNLTDFSVKLMTRSYVAVRSVLAPYPISRDNATSEEILAAAPKLEAKRPVLYLKAVVFRMRVYIWLATSIAFALSGLGLVWVESGCDRQPIADIAVVGLLTDSRKILESDETGLSNMSYLTRKDKRHSRKVKLRVLDTGQRNVFGLVY